MTLLDFEDMSEEAFHSVLVGKNFYENYLQKKKMVITSKLVFNIEIHVCE